MRRFSKHVLAPYIKESGYRRVCEIGSATGDNIDRLLAVPGMQICCVDPCVSADLVDKYASEQRVKVHRLLSLDALKSFDDVFDCIMIDGDHNWYTVFHELLLINDKGMLAKNGTIFLHDVCWPYARRDMYYDRSTVPEEFQHPSYQRGIVRGMSVLSSDSNQGLNGTHWNAQYEGGPRNGVLTAVEDFLQDHTDFTFFSFQREWGLGVLARRGENRAAIAQLQRKARLINTAEALKAAIRTATGRG